MNNTCAQRHYSWGKNAKGSTIDLSKCCVETSNLIFLLDVVKSVDIFLMPTILNSDDVSLKFINRKKNGTSSEVRSLLYENASFEDTMIIIDVIKLSHF